MRAPKKTPDEKLRPWRVALMRSRAHYLGVVYAPDEKSAEAAAVAEFNRRGAAARCSSFSSALAKAPISGRSSFAVAGTSVSARTLPSFLTRAKLRWVIC
jgi:hypothetical protein